MNSSADIKAFCGRNGGAVCTSSNAEAALEWAFAQHGADTKVLFLPDQHLGRNTAVLQDGPDPRRLRRLGPAPAQRRPHRRAAARREDDPVAGHCSVHGRFSPDTVDDLRATDPRRQHPGAPRVRARGGAQGRPRRLDGVHHQDRSRPRRPARPGRSAPSSTWSSGWPPPTPTSGSSFLDKTVCYCSTMNRIDLPHLVWALESLVDGAVVNHDPGRPRHRALGQGRAAADARPAGQVAPRLRWWRRTEPGSSATVPS